MFNWTRLEALNCVPICHIKAAAFEATVPPKSKCFPS